MHKLLLIMILVPVLLGPVTTLVYRIFHKKKLGTSVFLTFDDGISDHTEALLDLLKDHDIQATFFIVSSSLHDHPKTLNRMKKEGHTLAFHSRHHKNQLLMLPHSLYLDFMGGLEDFRIHKHEVTYFRPPWGHMSLWGLLACRSYGLTPVHWTKILGDWKAEKTVEDLKRDLLTVGPGDVVCLHDGRGKNQAPLRTIEALRQTLGEMKKKGLSFETLDALN